MPSEETKYGNYYLNAGYEGGIQYGAHTNTTVLLSLTSFFLLNLFLPYPLTSVALSRVAIPHAL